MKCPECKKEQEKKPKLNEGSFWCLHCYHSDEEEWNEQIMTCRKCGKQVEMKRFY